MNDKEIPMIKIETPETTDYTQEVEDIFSMVDHDMPEELLEIRKQQILNHSYNSSIVHTLQELLGMIGQKDIPYNRQLIEYYHEKLIDLHSPIYLEIQMHPNLFHWEEWTLADLYLHYCELVGMKGWRDYYNLNNIENVKNYHVVDMLNDLVVNNYIIGMYEPHSFMDLYNKERMLKDFKIDSVIAVNILEEKLK